MNELIKAIVADNEQAIIENMPKVIEEDALYYIDAYVEEGQIRKAEFPEISKEEPMLDPAFSDDVKTRIKGDTPINAISAEQAQMSIRIAENVINKQAARYI